jgi:beta-galactosidase
VDVVDKDGLTVPTASNNVTFTITGGNLDPGATVIGTGNGDPADHTPDKSLSRPAFHGLVLGVVQSTRSKDFAASVGTTLVAVVVSAPGLKSDTISISSKGIGQMENPQL